MRSLGAVVPFLPPFKEIVGKSASERETVYLVNAGPLSVLNFLTLDFGSIDKATRKN